ncbi:MAG: hypothetical protein NUV57_06485 [archaeon]|nr:hypothetical protein [archaeon]
MPVRKNWVRGKKPTQRGIEIGNFRDVGDFEGRKKEEKIFELDDYEINKELKRKKGK